MQNVCKLRNNCLCQALKAQVGGSEPSTMHSYQVACQKSRCALKDRSGQWMGVEQGLTQTLADEKSRLPEK